MPREGIKIAVLIAVGLLGATSACNNVESFNIVDASTVTSTENDIIVDNETEGSEPVDSDSIAEPATDSHAEPDVEDTSIYDTGLPPCDSTECDKFCKKDGLDGGECLDASCACFERDPNSKPGKQCFDDFCSYDSECCKENICARLFGSYEAKSSCALPCTDNPQVCSPVQVCGGIVGKSKICMLRGVVPMGEFRAAYNLNQWYADGDNNNFTISLSGLQYELPKARILHTRTFGKDNFDLQLLGYNKDSGNIIQVNMNLDGSYYKPGTIDLWAIAEDMQGMVYEITDYNPIDPELSTIWIRGTIVGGSLVFNETPEENGRMATGHLQLVLGRYDALME